MISFFIFGSTCIPQLLHERSTKTLTLKLFLLVEKLSLLKSNGHLLQFFI